MLTGGSIGVAAFACIFRSRVFTHSVGRSVGKERRSCASSSRKRKEIDRPVSEREHVLEDAAAHAAQPTSVEQCGLLQELSFLQEHPLIQRNTRSAFL